MVKVRCSTRSGQGHTQDRIALQDEGGTNGADGCGSLKRHLPDVGLIVANATAVNFLHFAVERL